MGGIRILGAGLSGLSAAISLARHGKEVKVFELRDDVGMRIGPSIQVVFGEDFFEKCGFPGLKVPKRVMTRHRIVTKSTDKVWNIEPKGQLITRGSKGSLEYSLYKIARKEGVEFEFGAKRQEKDVDIVASGPKRADAFAYGIVYGGASMPDNMTISMFSDKYSPRAWYMYAVPHSKGAVEIVNCTSKPHLQKAKPNFEKALKEVDCFREIVDGANPLYEVGGIGNFNFPKTCVKDGRIYVGEAAGFQDLTDGFGIGYALISGRLAAEAIAFNKDYDELWKRELADQLRFVCAKRFVQSLFGNWLADQYLKRKLGEDVLNMRDSYKSIQQNHGALVNTCCRLEAAKKMLLGYW